jgi:hypothetical protein
VLPSPPLPASHSDRIAALTSGFVAVLALVVSTYNVYLQRQQIRAQVWPRLLHARGVLGAAAARDPRAGGAVPALREGVGAVAPEVNRVHKVNALHSRACPAKNSRIVPVPSSSRVVFPSHTAG